MSDSEYRDLNDIPELKGFGDKGRRLKDVENLCRRYEEKIEELVSDNYDRQNENEELREDLSECERKIEFLKNRNEELREIEEDPYAKLEMILTEDEKYITGLKSRKGSEFYLKGNDPEFLKAKQTIKEMSEELEELRELKANFQAKERELKKKYNQEARKKHSLNRALKNKFENLGIKVRLINKETGTDKKMHIPFEIKHQEKAIALIHHHKGKFKIEKRSANEFAEGVLKVNGYDFAKTKNDYIEITPDTEIWKNNLQIKLLVENLN